jgi:hypothetical protein
VETDVFHFAYANPDLSTREDRLAVVVFANRALSDEEIAEAGAGTGSRGRSMISVGVLVCEFLSPFVEFFQRTFIEVHTSHR